MSRDDVIRMARAAGQCQLSDRQFQLHGLDTITRFAIDVADAARKQEREACANVAMDFRRGAGDPVCGQVADAIRARGLL